MMMGKMTEKDDPAASNTGTTNTTATTTTPSSSPSSSSCSFLLRADGLGNRLEQIMKLDLESYNHVTLYWPARSHGRGDTYKGTSGWIQVVDGPARDSSNSSSNSSDDTQNMNNKNKKNKTVVTLVDSDVSITTIPDNETLCNFRMDDTAMYARNARRIRPKHFAVTFSPLPAKITAAAAAASESNTTTTTTNETSSSTNNTLAEIPQQQQPVSPPPPPPIGIHIRLSDRLKKFTRDPHQINDFTTADEADRVLEQVTSMIQLRQPPEGVFLVSDDQDIIQRVRQELESAQVIIRSAIVTTATALTSENNDTNNSNVVSPPPPPFLVDFFGLAACHEVWMVSSFSSFAVLAARSGERGDVPLYSYWPPYMTNLARFRVPDVRPIVRWAVDNEWEQKDKKT